MKTRIWLALLAIYIAWGSTYLAIRFAVESIPPFFMAGTRFLVAGLIVYTWRRLAGDPAPTRIQWRSAAVIGVFLLVGGNGGVSWAEQHVPSGITALIVAAVPLWVVLIDALLPGRNRPTWLTATGVLIGILGIFVLADPTGSVAGGNGQYVLGLGILVLAAFSWALGSIYGRGADLPKSSLLGTGMEMLAGSAGLLLLGLVSGELKRLDLPSITLPSITGLVYLILVGSLIGFVAYSWLLRVAPTSLVVTYAYVNPLVAVILGNLLAQEVITARVLVATPLILSAVALIYMNKGKLKPRVSPPLSIPNEAGDD
jgi:drug/metabolite transporter (DMT)-like permease